MLRRLARAALTLTSGLILWGHGGYALFLMACMRRKGAGAAAGEVPEDRLPTVTVVVPAYNEAEIIEDKIRSTLNLDYPADRLTIIIASDGSDDATVRIAGRIDPARVRVLDFKQRRGRALACNDAVAAATSEWLLFTDAETRLAEDCLRHMAPHLVSDDVGMVDGELVCVNPGRGAMAQDVGFYWKLESRLKALESQVGCLSSTFGACSAVRRDLYRPLAATEDVDFTTPLDTVVAGYRVVHEPRAIAYEVTHDDVRSQFNARVRMITKNLPGTVRKLRGPVLRRPLVLTSVVSHKLLRWLMPLVFVAHLAAALALRRERLGRGVASAYAGGAALGAAGAAATRVGRHVPFASQVFNYALANAAFAVGVLQSVRRKQVSYYAPSRVATRGQSPPGPQRAARLFAAPRHYRAGRIPEVDTRRTPSN